MRERKKAGFWEGCQKPVHRRWSILTRDSPKIGRNSVPALAMLYGAFRSVGSWLWSLRKASPNQLPADPSRGLAIGLITVNQYAGNSQAGNEIRSRRRRHLVDAILELAADPHVRSFALARALDGLNLPELEQLLDELDETYYGIPRPSSAPIPPKPARNRDTL
jgi:hypothetical protein